MHVVYIVYYRFIITGLPDAASEEAASWVEPGNDRTVVIDASTAFRVNDDWVYGFPGMYATNYRHVPLFFSAPNDVLCFLAASWWILGSEQL